MSFHPGAGAIAPDRAAAFAPHGVVAELLRHATLYGNLDASRDDLAQARAAPGAGEPDPGKDRRRPLPIGTKLAPWGVKKLEVFIADNMHRTLNTQTLASLVRLSGSHFTRACKNTFGVTPHALLMRRRIERAQAMMVQTRETLSQIAYACGFADQAHLSRLFRQMTGATPTRWRREHVVSD
jgi:transcriptional regulator GlxA family with amidase domain